MKIITLCSLSAGLGAAALGAAQGGGGQGGGGQSTFLGGQHQLNVVCVHNHESGDQGSTILYREKVVNGNELHGRIRMGRLTAVVVRFTKVNTFCYVYKAGVTKQVSFYGGSMPGPLKNFFVGGLAPIFVAAGAGDFLQAQFDFKNHYDSYGSLGQLIVDVRSQFAKSIDPKLTNTQIRDAVLANLRSVEGLPTDRDVQKEDFTVRQSELQAGVDILIADLKKLRSLMTPSNASDFQMQKGVLARDEAAVSLLSGQLNNYGTAIANLQTILTCQDEIEIPIMLDAHNDEFEVTAAVALVGQTPTQSNVISDSNVSTKSVTIDVTGTGGLDFSTGVVAMHPVSHDYYVRHGTGGTIADGGARDSFVPAAFVHYYIHPAPGQFAIGPTFGVDLSSGQNFFFGLSVIRGGPQRLMLVGGLALNKLTLLNGDKVGFVPNGNSIQYKTRYVGGYFIGLSFNLGG